MAGLGKDRVTLPLLHPHSPPLSFPLMLPTYRLGFMPEDALTNAFPFPGLVGQASFASLARVQRALGNLTLRGSLHTSSVLGKDSPSKENTPAMKEPDLGASPLFDLTRPTKKDIPVKESDKDASVGLRDDSSKASEKGSKKDTKVTAKTEDFPYSHQKLRFMASQVAQTKVSDALKQLEHHPRKKAARYVFSALLHAQREASRHHGIKNDEAYIGRPSSHMKVIIGRAPTAEDANAGIARRRNINGWPEKKRVWTALVDKPIYNPKPYYNW
ncbi:hypothetical protein BJ684DRAFT_17031 [Piptocephalis cylindrospora]|uniref:Ribosomal protein L22/L17 n=1 Tax=Piptocephalis cylindrospora TaxID=1907219 RepID=A0A4P9Y0Y9_9FUNG|nr:hypothetical protein BJ684DRAFT_17031 [Piptocephalis cylindrospora]|eukprot:RKP12486.1 hypothetical protein BJ684DRAFT_17031 [Piptocephalis cylindrospora]